MDIEYIIKCLHEINDIYGNIFLSSNFCRNKNRITWGRYETGIYSKLLYAKEYEKLVTDRQYSFLLKDKSFFQFYYEFDNGDITKAKLCYYPYPIANQEDSIELEEYFDQSGTDKLETYYFGLKELQDIGVISTNNSHFRLDYDSNVASHCQSHAQYGGINSLRIPFNQLINPFLFFDFILRSTLEEYSEMVGKLEGKKSYKACRDLANDKIMEVSVECGLHLQYIA